MAERDDEDEEFDIGISLESVAAIVDAARAVQDSDEDEDEEDADEGLDAEDDENMDEDALRAFIADLNEDEQAALIALAWVGRGDYSAEEFEEARTLARERNMRDPAQYLLGIDLLGDILEEGLAELGLSLEDSD